MFSESLKWEYVDSLTIAISKPLTFQGGFSFCNL
jgi:hypothetical protein